MSRQSVFAMPAPAVAAHISPDRVAVACMEYRGGQPVVASHAIEPLPAGSVVPALNATNILNRAEVAGTLKRAFDRIGVRARRIGLVVPDSVAKVSLVKFDKVPPRTEDLDQLVRWQVKKSAPFRIEEAQVTYTPGAFMPDGGREFIVSLARRDIIGEYEAVCADAGAHAGIVDLASFNVINAVLASSAPPTSDWLLVNVTPEYASLAIMRGENLIFFRNRLAEGEGSLADVVHQTAMYYEDRLNGAGFARVILAGAASTGESRGSEALHDLEQLRRGLEERLGTRVESVDPRQAAGLADRIVAAPPLLDALAPLVGMVLREQVSPASR
jgi:type IV pilus assembly protein PilM